MSQLITPETIFLFNKADLVPTRISPEMTGLFATQGGAWAVSLSTGAGVTEFLTGFARSLRNRQDMVAFAEGRNVDIPISGLICKKTISYP